LPLPVLLLLLALTACDVKLPTERDSPVDRYIDSVRTAGKLPGISVAVGRGDSLIYSYGSGLAELDNRVPATGQTVHNIASVSKTMAAVALMQLIERGTLTLDDDVRRWVPYFPRKRWTVRLRHILTHTSGIRHYVDGGLGRQNWKERIHYSDFREAVALFGDSPLLFKPGTEWHYSSYAYNLLHGVIEKASGRGFEEYLRKTIWEPAGMAQTQFDVPQRIVQGRGRGYELIDDSVLVNADYVDPSYKYAGGGIISSAEDLVRFGLALNAGKLLRRETLDEMYRVQLDAKIRKHESGEALSHGQALCWWIRSDGEHAFPSHRGSVKGVRSYLIVDPQRDLVVALIANRLPFNPVVQGNWVGRWFGK